MSEDGTKPVTRVCPSCGRVLKEEFVACPYCGKDLTGKVKTDSRAKGSIKRYLLKDEQIIAQTRSWGTPNNI